MRDVSRSERISGFFMMETSLGRFAVKGYAGSTFPASGVGAGVFNPRLRREGWNSNVAVTTQHVRMEVWLLEA